ncbi:lytic murein transglycosylase B [Candidatus Pandoraea novymonadis]|nr:lytic murein transglycosylase B [Candidatus Pandoraea novymonadis]
MVKANPLELPNISLTISRKFIHLLHLVMINVITLTVTTPALAKSDMYEKLVSTIFEEEVRPNRYANRSEVDAFINELVIHEDFDRATLKKIFAQTVFSETTAKLVAPPSTTAKKNWQAYQSRFLDSTRINNGVRFWNENSAALARASQIFGVPEEIIVAIIGVETIYGRHMGNFRILDTLTTLAFDYPPAPNRSRRMTLFRNELANLLIYAREQHIDPFSLYGSYAGAIGIPQFMPSSIRAYAIDFSGDRKINLTRNVSDAIGSVGNFLKMHGWETKRPIVWHISPDLNSQRIAEKGADGQPDPHHKLENFIKIGLLINEPKLNLSTELNTPILIVDLPTPNQPTEYRIGLKNFSVLTRYNRSFFYAMAVYDLSEAIKAARRN